jgi:hypothetical protein
MIKYLEDHFSNYTVDIEPPKRLPRVNVNGYGHKIPTSYVVNFRQPGKKCRVYATCWSNVASFWVTRRGVVYHLQNWDFVQSFDNYVNQNKEVHDGNDE